jgi:urease gamma subunit
MSETTKREQREATSIKIKPEIWKEAKIEAIREGKTVSELMEEAITKWITEHKKSGK